MSTNPSTRPGVLDVEGGHAEGIRPHQTGPAVNQDTVLPSFYSEQDYKKDSTAHSDSHDGKEVVELAKADIPEDTPTDKGVFGRAIDPIRPYKKHLINAFLVLFGLGFWIPTLIVNRDFWIPVTVIVWFFIGLIFFQYVPTTTFSRPIEQVWVSTIETPWMKLNSRVRLGLGWLALLGLVFGSAYGFKLESGTTYAQRTQGVFGLFVFQLGFYIFSAHHKAIQWRTVIVGLAFQQILAMFVLKSGAGFAIFNWIAQLASDFLTQSYYGSAFLFSDDVIFKGFWFFANTLGAIIFFIAFAEMMYYLGVLQWLIAKVGWFFLKTMNVSGAEAVVAAASPFIGQGESACMVKPYVNSMTASEIHLTMTSGFATIAGSVLAAYIGFGMPAVFLVTSAVMSIPASLAASKLRYPETEEPLTRGKIVVVRESAQAHNALHAFSNGAWFGLRVAGLILCNVLTIIALVHVVDAILAYIGRSWGITATNSGPLSLELIFSYVFYPLSWLMGVPKEDLLTVSRILGIKFTQNEFVAYLELSTVKSTMTTRGFNIAVYSVCGFGNLGSLGIQIGVLSALGPARKATIVKVAFSALVVGFLCTCQTAGIAGQLL